MEGCSAKLTEVARTINCISDSICVYENERQILTDYD